MLCGLRFCTAFVLRGEGMAARLSARRAAKYLRGQRVHQAVFPKDYPHKDVFARYGILPPSDRALRQVKAAEIICCAMEKLGLQKSRARIALIAASPSAACSSRLKRAVAAAVLWQPRASSMTWIICLASTWASKTIGPACLPAPVRASWLRRSWMPYMKGGQVMPEQRRKKGAMPCWPPVQP